MKIIEFNSTGQAYSDHSAEAEALAFFMDDSRDTVTVSTSNFIMAARALVYEGKFPYDQLEFRYQEHSMVPDRYGRLRDWPNGFCDHNDGWLMRLLDKPHWAEPKGL